MPKGCDVAGGRKCHPREDRVHAVPAGPGWSTPCAKSEVEMQLGWNRRLPPRKGCQGALPGAVRPARPHGPGACAIL